MKPYKKHTDHRTLILMLAKKCPSCDIENPPDCAMCEIRKLGLTERYRKVINLSNDEIELLVDEHEGCVRNELGSTYLDMK